MRFHFLHRRSKTAPGTEAHAWAFGAKTGYWPCHGGPFLTVEFATHRIDIWYGTPSTEAGLPSAAEAWDEGFEAGHLFNEYHPSGVSADPPLNPYED